MENETNELIFITEDKTYGLQMKTPDFTPDLPAYFEFTNQVGITYYLMVKDVVIEDYVFATNIADVLSLLESFHHTSTVQPNFNGNTTVPFEIKEELHIPNVGVFMIGLIQEKILEYTNV